MKTPASKAMQGVNRCDQVASTPAPVVKGLRNEEAPQGLTKFAPRTIGRGRGVR